ncbi:MAG: Arylsulfatase, partial [uncultured Phycisphaerae bacterium]
DRQRLDPERGRAEVRAQEQAVAVRRRAADAGHGPLDREGAAADGRRAGVVRRHRADLVNGRRVEADQGDAGPEPARRRGREGPQGGRRRLLHAQRGRPEPPGVQPPLAVGGRGRPQADPARPAEREGRPRAVRPVDRPARDEEPGGRRAADGRSADEAARRLVAGEI